MAEYNTIIIGSGIAGMSCAIYLKRAGISTLIIENSVPGGQLNRASTIENYPGYQAIEGPDLAMNIYNQVIEYGVEFDFGDIEFIDYERKIVHLKEKEYAYQHLVFATGRREKRLELEHEETFLGKGISFCATCDGSLYKNQDVIVVGGGNSAVSEAIYLSAIVNKVTLIYRNTHLRADEVLQNQLKDKENVETIYDGIVTAYVIDDGRIKGVKLKDGKEILGNCIFLAIGSVPNGELFDGKKENGYIIVDHNYETSRKEVYACGDVIKKELYQLITASSEGAMVATSIIKNQVR